MKATIFDYIKNNKLGTLTVFFSLSLMFIGLPAQIWRVWQQQSAKEISVVMFGLSANQSIFWMLYGRQKKDWFLITANFFNALFCATIVAEWMVLH